MRLNPDASVLMHGATTRVKTLAELQKKFGWELHGEVKTCDPKDNDLTPESMGGSTVTFRLPWGPRAHLARPMLADAKIDGRWPAVPEYAGGRFPGFFWRVADGDYSECPFNDNFPDMTSDRLWHPDSSNGYDLGVNHGASWYVGAEDKYVDPKVTHREGAQPRRVQLRQPLAGDGRRQARGDAGLRGLLVDALDGRLPGAKTTRLFQDVRQGRSQPAAKATPVVYVQFINATGRQMTRAYLVGRDADGEARPPRTDQGRIPLDGGEGSRSPPRRSAVRMALALGILPCKGEVGFDDINVKTADGPKPAGEMRDRRGQAGR